MADSREVAKIQARINELNKEEDITAPARIDRAARRGKVPRNGFFGSVTDSALQRLAYKANCTRIGTDVYPSLRSCLSNFLARACQNAEILSDRRGKTNITGPDVLYGLEMMDVVIHGAIHKPGRAARRERKWNEYAPLQLGTISVRFFTMDNDNPDTVLPGLAAWRATRTVPPGSSLAVVTGRNFSRAHPIITPEAMDHNLSLQNMVLVRAELTRQDVPTELTGFAIVRPFDPYLFECEKIRAETGFNVMSAISTAAATASARQAAWASRAFVARMEAFERMFFEPAVRDPLHRAGAFGQVWPQRDIVRRTDDPLEFVAGIGSFLGPVYIRIDLADKARIADRHWLPPDLPPDWADSETWATDWLDALGIANNDDPPAARYIVQIIDAASRTFFDRDENQLVNLTSVDSLLRDIAQGGIRRRVRLDQAGQLVVAAPGEVLQDDVPDSTAVPANARAPGRVPHAPHAELDYCLHTTQLSTADALRTVGVRGGFLLQCSRARARQLLETPGFLKVQVFTHTEPSAEFLLAPADRNDVFLWRPAEIPAHWQQ